jgi:hypothetical protein
MYALDVSVVIVLFFNDSVVVIVTYDKLINCVYSQVASYSSLSDAVTEGFRAEGRLFCHDVREPRGTDHRQYSIDRYNGNRSTPTNPHYYPTKWKPVRTQN